MTCKFVIADQNAISIEGHFQTYTSELARAAQSLGCETIILWNHRFPLENYHSTYRMLGVFTFTEAEAAARNILAYGKGHFGFELEQALKTLALGAPDHVVIHTCHFVELVEAFEYFLLLPPVPDLPTFHIVLRYDPDVYCYRMSRLLRCLGAIQRTQYLREKLRLHSDTQQLAAEFERLFSTPVGVCPIPVDLGNLLPALRNAAKSASSRPLVASYLGPARSEKGYRDILDAIAFLRMDHIETNNLHFVLQCSERSIKSEPGLADYQQKLEAYIREHGLENKIRLVKHVVDQKEYCNIIAQSDIILIAYSPVSYRYRSSSILMEAMATGKVIVTRQGSWMASRVGPDNAVCYAESGGLGPALAEAVAHFDKLNAGAKARQAFAIEEGASTTLARYFLGLSVNSERTNSGPVILMIADGEVLASGTLVASLFLHHLSCYAWAGYQIDVVLLGSVAMEDFVVRRRIVDVLRPYRLGSLSFLAYGGRVAHDVRDRSRAIYLAEGIDIGVISALGLTGTPLFRGTIASDFYPFLIKPAQIKQLAGPINAFELVGSCDPVDGKLEIDNQSFIACQSRYQQLLMLESIDILLHATDSSSLRRFFDQVFTPFFADHEITVLVIGDVEKADYGRNFILIGSVMDRDPLYAAAKIVLTTEGRFAPISISESLSRGKPTFLFGRLNDFEDSDLNVFDNASKIAEVILGLLSSPVQRLNEGKRSLKKAYELGVGKSGKGITAVFSLLGIVEPFNDLDLSISGVDQDELVEWDPIVQAANHFVRGVISDEPLYVVDDLADDVLKTVGLVSKALIDECDAPLLRVDGSLRTMALRRQSKGGAVEVLKLFKVVSDTTGKKGDAGRSLRFAINQRFSTKITLVGISDAEKLPPQTLAQFFGEEHEDKFGCAVWRSPLMQDEQTELVSVKIETCDALRSIEIMQEIPLDLRATVFGRNIFFNWSFDDDRLVVQETTASGVGRFQMFESIKLKVQSLLSSWSPWSVANPLFDEKWYLETYPKVMETGLEAFRHYERFGIRKGYRPNPFFNADWYARQYSTLPAIAWRHYLMRAHDPRQDPGEFFSGSRYLARNRDVAANWPWGPLLHYTLLGRTERRVVYPAEDLRPHQSLALPVVVGNNGKSWVEILLEMPATSGVAPINLYVNEHELDTVSFVEGGLLSLRALLPNDVQRTGLVYVNVTLKAGRAPVEICGLRTGWVLTR